MLVAGMKDLGGLVRAERKRQGLTQTDLAAFAGVGVTFVSQLENGKQTVEMGKVIGVLETLGIDLFAERRG